jgi:hypothetical protein
MVMLAMAALLVQDSWTGSVETYEVDAFPKGLAQGKIHFGTIEDAETWNRLWKRLDRKAPKVDFEKSVVVFVYYAKWPGSLAVGLPSMKDGIVTIDIGLDGKKPREEKKEEPKQDTPQGSSIKCHYEYEMRVQAREGVKTIRLTSEDKVLGEIALKKS